MARRKKHEEHANHEAWAIPYGDLVTLLLAFFVVMYAMSSVNEGKYRVLSDSLFAAFRGAPRTMEPVQVGDKQVGSGADIKTSIVAQSMIDGQPRSMLTPLPMSAGAPTRPASESDTSSVQAAAAKELQRVAEQVEQAMDDLVKANMVVVRRKDFWIEVEIKTDILFPSAKAQLEPKAIDVIGRLGASLAPFPNSIRVEGHTDNRPIKTVAFFSNWELSAARAGSVVRVLASKGISPDRLAVIGYGENRPTHPNATEDGRNANRRVVVVILSAELGKAVNQAMPNSDGSAPEAPGSPNPATLAPGTQATATTLAPGTLATIAAGTPASAPVPSTAPVSSDSAIATPLPSANP
ncbi:MAG: flagellar motor protein MotD [Gammaproteobacteria bacterium]